MAQNKRTNLTLDPELDALITEISDLREIPKTRVITEILEESKPQLEIIRDALKTIKTMSLLVWIRFYRKCWAIRLRILVRFLRGLIND